MKFRDISKVITCCIESPVEKYFNDVIKSLYMAVGFSQSKYDAF